jgi:predicted Zn finger-like uncharacterized protein
MALATQCPHCQTTFRVAHDQLKLRAGLVRCGACKQIFNGIENLLRVDEAGQTLPPDSLPLQASSPALAMPSAAAADFVATTMPAADEPKPDNPMLRMTLLDFAHVPRKPSVTEESLGSGSESAPTEVETADPIEQAIEDLQSKPWRSESAAANAAPTDDALDRVDSAEYEEPAFVRQARKKQELREMLHSTLGIATLVLLLALPVQLAFALLDQIAAHFPSTRPALVAACGYLGCTITLPAQIDAISIESNELQNLSADGKTFSLTVLLSNRSRTAQAWPNIELTLNDANEMPLLRRVFVPHDYLPTGQDLNKGFAARSEQPVKLSFELSQLQASGYRVYLFYP